MVTFASDEQLRFLGKSDFWIMDGTYKSAPGIFEQLFAIHSNFHGQWWPAVFALMVRKTKTAYAYLLQVLKDEISHILGRHLEPEYASKDYEAAFIGAGKDQFQRVEIAGCLFHLRQSFWRRLQNEGLMERYNEEGSEELRGQFRPLTGLAFVPEYDVADAFDDEDVLEDL